MNTQTESNTITKNTGILNQEEISFYLKDIRKLKVMTADRERELSEKMLSGECSDKEKNDINRELLEGNLRFVITIAKQYQNQGVDLADLIAEGNVGLMKAIHNFDWSKKLRFISYAVWWVRQSILQSLNENARTIRLPVNVVQELQRSKKAVDKGLEEFNEKLATLPTTFNLESTINEDGDTLLDMIENPNATMPDEDFDNKKNLKERLYSTMKVLDERERAIVEDYFGLTGTPRTLEDIGDDFNLTKERVRQIKERALRKLRNECSTLFDYL